MPQRRNRDYSNIYNSYQPNPPKPMKETNKDKVRCHLRKVYGQYHTDGSPVVIKVCYCGTTGCKYLDNLSHEEEKHFYEENLKPEALTKEPNKFEEIMEDFDNFFTKDWRKYAHTPIQLEDTEKMPNLIKSFIKKVYHQGREEGYKKGREDERKEIVEMIEEQIKIEEIPHKELCHPYDKCCNHYIRMEALNDLQDKLKE